MFEGAYPPGVTGKMIDEYFGEGLPDPCCNNCVFYDGDSCERLWNNGDPEYYIPERDDREPEDYCDDWEGK